MEPVRDALAELYAGVVEARLAGPDENARNVAEWTICADVLRHLAEYVPLDIPATPPAVQALRRMDAEEIRDALTQNPAPALVQAFGQYRYDVTLAECRNAGRLQVLCSTLQSLMRIRLQATEVEAVDRAIDTIGNWINRVWRVDPPLAGDIRSWCIQRTYRPDVLPNMWRTI